MKKSFIYLSLVLLAAGTGCKKYLETAPDLRTELNTPEKVAELLATAYPKASYITFMEAMSDNAVDKGVASSDIVNRDPWFFKDMAERNSDSPDNYWQAAYSAIAAANHALDAIKNASDPTPYQASKGEALVARAYAHFMLVTIFSKVYDPASAAQAPGIPYVTEPEKVVVRQYERKTVAYVYEQIEKDLNEGLPLIDNNSYKKAPKYHFTTSAAHAFAARFYLFKKDYNKVVEHANKCFPGGNILPFLRPVNSPGYRGMEALVKLAEYSKATQKANLLLVEAPSLWGRSLRGYRYGFSSSMLYKLIWGPNVTTGLWGYMFYGNSETLFTPKFREHFVKQDPNATIGVPHNMIPLFTAEEVLFNRAEANTMLGNYTAALKDLNEFASQRIIIDDNLQPYYDETLHKITEEKIKAFYGAVDIKSGLVTTILDFKRVEFLFEGLRWLDILRHRLTVVHTSFDGRTKIISGPEDPRRVVQIPQEAQMSGVGQNPR